MKLYTAFLIPQFNLPIRDPITKVIMLETGEIKSLVGKEGRYWRRRLKDGSVKIGKQFVPEKKQNYKEKIKLQRKNKEEN